MDHLWSPWRYRYIAKADKVEGCVFCRIRDEVKDDENYVVVRGQLNFVILNLFPYTSGHLMIVPYEHLASLAAVPTNAANEVMLVARRADELGGERVKRWWGGNWNNAAETT